jgi:hypothetical protein
MTPCTRRPTAYSLKLFLKFVESERRHMARPEGSISAADQRSPQSMNCQERGTSNSGTARPFPQWRPSQRPVCSYGDLFNSDSPPACTPTLVAYFKGFVRIKSRSLVTVDSVVQRSHDLGPSAATSRMKLAAGEFGWRGESLGLGTTRQASPRPAHGFRQ